MLNDACLNTSKIMQRLQPVGLLGELLNTHQIQAKDGKILVMKFILSDHVC